MSAGVWQWLPPARHRPVSLPWPCRRAPGPRPAHAASHPAVPGPHSGHSWPPADVPPGWPGSPTTQQYTT